MTASDGNASNDEGGEQRPEQNTPTNGRQPNVLVTGDKLDTLRYTREDLKHAQNEAAQDQPARESRQPITTHALDPQRIARVLRWGTLLEDVQRITFRIAGYEQTITMPVIGTVTLGRSDNRTNYRPDLDLTRYGGHAAGVSRQHARLYIEDGMLKVMDLKSINGTFLNGSRLPPLQARIVRNEDELQLGKLVLHILSVSVTP
jgi:hypothetical protein